MADSTASTNAKGSHCPPGTRRLGQGLVTGHPEIRRHLAGQCRVTRMITRASKPVFCVRIIRLATVHDPVQKTAVRAGKILRDIVRGIEMVVPK